MCHQNPHDDTNLKTILNTTGFPVYRRPEWRQTNFNNRFQSDFTVLGKNILISRPAGYAELQDAQQSFNLGYEVIRECFPDNARHILIEDYSGLSGVSLDARKFFINDLKHRKNVLGIIFCNTSALFNLSISLGKRIYLPHVNVHLAKNLTEAIKEARRILVENNCISPESICSPRHNNHFPVTHTKDDWTLYLDGYTLRFEIIDNDILHPVPSGYLKKAHVDPIFEFQKKVFSEFAPDTENYYILSDMKALKSATFGARRLFVQSLKKWYETHPFQMIVFYNTNWIMRAAVNIAKTSTPFEVYIADDFNAAIALVNKDKKRQHLREPVAVAGDNINPRMDQKHVDDLINILSGISWKTMAPDEITGKLDPAHPFFQVAEAISLIKMDMDQVLSEQKETETKLLKSREKYKNILNSIEEGYYEVDVAGYLTFFNDSLCRILGYTGSEMRGMNYRRLSDKNYARIIYETFNQVYETGKPAKAFNWKLIRRDKTVKCVETSISCIHDDDGRHLGFRGIVRDITHRLAAEKEKEKLETRLRHAQKMEAIGTLAGGVAHDLNNILSGLVSYPDLLLLKLPPESPLRKPIQTIRKSGEKAAAIVQDLLTLARRGLPDQAIVNLNTLIEEYLISPEHESLLAHHPAVGAIFRPDRNLLNMSASEVHILKIIMNLVINAAEAMPEGGTICISTKNLFISTPISGYSDIKEGEYVKLQVVDTGIGMSAADQDRIFEPFYTRKKMGRSGSGLGMAMVWGAVHDHNGYIEVASRPGNGTTISIYFPAVHTGISTDSDPQSINLYTGRKETILVVDDIAEQRELAVQTLTQLGYTATAVPSGKDAVRHIRHQPADLIIIDMIMDPGMDGLDTYKEIISINPGQKAIIATGYSTSDRILQAQAIGAGACLKKPYSVRALAQTVREALDT